MNHPSITMQSILRYCHNEIDHISGAKIEQTIHINVHLTFQLKSINPSLLLRAAHSPGGQRNRHAKMITIGLVPGSLNYAALCISDFNSRRANYTLQ